MRRKADDFYAYLNSDADCSFAEWLQRRGPARGVTMPLGLTVALAVVLLCVAGAVAVLTKAGGLW